MQSNRKFCDWTSCFLEYWVMYGKEKDLTRVGGSDEFYSNVKVSVIAADLTNGFNWTYNSVVKASLLTRALHDVVAKLMRGINEVVAERKSWRLSPACHWADSTTLFLHILLFRTCLNKMREALKKLAPVAKNMTLLHPKSCLVFSIAISTVLINTGNF